MNGKFVIFLEPFSSFSFRFSSKFHQGCLLQLASIAMVKISRNGKSSMLPWFILGFIFGSTLVALTISNGMILHFNLRKADMKKTRNGFFSGVQLMHMSKIPATIHMFQGHVYILAEKHLTQLEAKVNIVFNFPRERLIYQTQTIPILPNQYQYLQQALSQYRYQYQYSRWA